MRKKVKIISIIYVLVMSYIILHVDNLRVLSTKLEYIKCGSATGIPKPVPQLITIGYTLLITGTPIILIIFSIVEITKSVVSGDAERTNKAKDKLLRKFVITSMVFLTASIVQFVLVRFTTTESDENTFANCVKCFLFFNSNNCVESDSTNDVVDETYHSNYSNLSEKTASNRVTKSESLGSGYGKPISVSIKNNTTDANGRCGKGSHDYCIGEATVTYPNKTVTYYMGYQNNSGLLGGSCRSHAMISAINAIKGTNYSTLDIQNYLYSTNDGGVLKSKQIPKVLSKYGVKANVYHSELSKKKAAKYMKQAINNGQPVMIFVAHSSCPDLAGSHHALLLLGLDSDDNVQFIDSAGYFKSAKKRNVDELAQCLSGKSIADSYYRMIIFSV